MSDLPPWNNQPNEPMVWFERFDKFYRPLGAERSLLSAYRAWKKVEKSQKTAQKSEIVRNSPKKSDEKPPKLPTSVPPTWREAAVRWRWESRAAAWDKAQAAERRQAELQAIQKSRDQRISLLNVTFNKALTALGGVQTHGRPLGEVTNAVRVVVQELRQEYRLLEEIAAPAGKGQGGEGIPGWGDMGDLPEEELTAVLRNLMVAESLRNTLPTP